MTEVSDNKKREAEFVREWMSKSKQKGDFHFLKVHAWTGQGDWTPADVGQPLEERDL